MVPAAGPVVIADLEYTTWEGALAGGWSAPGQFRETVQIGAVRVEAGDGFREIENFSILVQPTINPVLSDYFTDLTGITNDEVVREGTRLEDALAAFSTFVGADIVLSHGRDDLILHRECMRKGVDNPFADSAAAAAWRDINPPLRAITGRRLDSSGLPAFFGLDPVGRAHSALADARALARVLAHLRAGQRI